jgi:hypothetical protein
VKLVALAGLVALALGGCAYAPMAATHDGTMYVVKSDRLLFGLLTKVFACTANGGTLTCKELQGAP